ncbi:aldehyde dehydrogenase family protein [Nesterenkonia haasae]|uniref:aldehyde dehydrogenase family protein n=1 Tax=Nesterenkonia haasae TaxID=2587813 RepID=UPI0038B236D0
MIEDRRPPPLITASEVGSGYIWINETEKRWLAMPFDGYKNSGTGHEHAKETMDSYSKQKSISVILNGPSVRQETPNN